MNSLHLAALILHEAIHAEIFRYVDKYVPGEDPNDRVRLFQLYQYYLGLTNTLDYTENQAVSDAQHVYMAENYVTPIANALRTLDNNTHPLEYYMGFGWDGLRKYAFNGQLTEEQDSQYIQYQQQVNQTYEEICN